MTEVEQFIREMVARTGEPVLFRPPDARFRLFAIGGDDFFILFCGPRWPEARDDWAVATGIAFSTVREWKLGVDGVILNGVDRCVVCTALGLSLLQLGANRAGKQFELQLWA
jgi:hypothetical protein